MKFVHIIILGSVFDGLQAYGPFDDYKTAAAWAENAQDEWHNIRLPIIDAITKNIIVGYFGTAMHGLEVRLFPSERDAVLSSQHGLVGFQHLQNPN